MADGTAIGKTLIMKEVWLMRDRAEKAMQGLALLMSLVLFFTVVALTSGCCSPDCGSKTVVGNHYSLPKISSDSTDFDFEIYESTEGAVVYTRKDSRVGITFSNVYTNCIFGIWDKAGLMTLSVEIEPLATEGSEETGGEDGISDFRSQISESEGKALGTEESRGKALGTEESEGGALGTEKSEGKTLGTEESEGKALRTEKGKGEEKSGKKGKTLGLEESDGKEKAE